MNRVLPPVAETVPVQRPAPPRVFHRIILHSLLLLIAAAAFVAYQHLKLNGQSTQALLSLVAAGLLALAPLRALIGELCEPRSRRKHYGASRLASRKSPSSPAPAISHRPRT
jgi:hypothetical protein